MNTIVKEVSIIILLIIVIFLLLAVIFYEYMPISIAIPEKVEKYVVPSEIKEEIEEEVVQYSKQIDSVDITDANMKDYLKTKSYNQTKEDPFLPYYTEYYNLDSDSGRKKVDNMIGQSDLGYNPDEDVANKAVEEEASKSSKLFDTKVK